MTIYYILTKKYEKYILFYIFGQEKISDLLKHNSWHKSEIVLECVKYDFGLIKPIYFYKCKYFKLFYLTYLLIRFSYNCKGVLLWNNLIKHISALT